MHIDSKTTFFGKIDVKTWRKFQTKPILLNGFEMSSALLVSTVPHSARYHDITLHHSVFDTDCTTEAIFLASNQRLSLVISPLPAMEVLLIFISWFHCKLKVK